MANYKVRVYYTTYADINVYDVNSKEEAVKYAMSENGKFDADPNTMYHRAKAVKGEVIKSNLRDWREDVW